MKITLSHSNQPTIESLQAQVEELTAKENNLSPYHYLCYLFETLPNIDLNNKEEIDKVLPWSMDLPSSCRVPKKSEANKK
ncbi:transposase domain-containing protein [Bacillus sp. DX1.1]|uniref:transposase domain-containing protein n=1 Tax=unclassified Bacillus (in: firmicutes) TaxID=185979 RepID=UPI00256FB79E|nr:MULTISPECIES: transposase domain-containing protein [unclassified Bacillus (in: firmicutes)]MDM5155480.1 transposase domain-containing protein [Bacillus sp. DX1.1]WJE84105.1 transposase domain-containing protein [Bacillus sp. DX3.1]